MLLLKTGNKKIVSCLFFSIDKTFFSYIISIVRVLNGPMEFNMNDLLKRLEKLTGSISSNFSDQFSEADKTAMEKTQNEIDRKIKWSNIKKENLEKTEKECLNVGSDSDAYGFFHDLKSDIRNCQTYIDKQVEYTLMKITSYFKTKYNLDPVNSWTKVKHEEIQSFDVFKTINFMFEGLNIKDNGYKAFLTYFQKCAQSYREDSRKAKIQKGSISFPRLVSINNGYSGKLELSYYYKDNFKNFISAIIYFFKQEVDPAIIHSMEILNYNYDVRNDFEYDNNDMYFKLSFCKNGKVTLYLKNVETTKEFFEYYKLG